MVAYGHDILSQEQKKIMNAFSFHSCYYQKIPRQSQVWWCMPLSAWETTTDLCYSETSLVYIGSSRLDWATA